MVVGTGVDQNEVVLAGVVVRRNVEVVTNRLVVVGMVVELMVVGAREVPIVREVAGVVVADVIKVVRGAVVVVMRTVVDVVGARVVVVTMVVVGAGVVPSTVTLSPVLAVSFLRVSSGGVVVGGTVPVVVGIVQHAPASSACTQSVTPHAPRRHSPSAASVPTHITPDNQMGCSADPRPSLPQHSARPGA